PQEQAGFQSAWHLYAIQIDSARAGAERDELFKALRAEGIGSAVHFPPIHLHPYYRERFGYQMGDYPVAEAVSKRLLTLPLFQAMMEEDVEDVLTSVQKIFSYYERQNRMDR
ncbi:MAG: DegT/DnrJ/EryC1/StrS aminotransferase family protein, partial [Candidatus Omnitrophica bacterium]|nr:DegT/DnrJ/EryC1/StrS aminotransferase family protein [Candidatus Omnitrophota bacterium]